MYERGKLTPRQRKFADLYLELGNATEAARQAGFQPAYAQGAKRQPAVQAYLAEHRRELPCSAKEIWDFLNDVMRGKITVTDLQTEAGFELGRRAGLWRDKASAKKLLMEENHES